MHMILDRNHLHIDEQDPVADWLVKSTKAVQTGSIKLESGGELAVKIDIINHENKNKIKIDLLQPTFFRTPTDETGLFDKLKSAKEFAKKLTDNKVTISFLRSGKEAITLGSDAKPRLSKIISRSNDLQIDSIIETTHLKRDLKTD
jgi:hypothetical protein